MSRLREGHFIGRMFALVLTLSAAALHLALWLSSL